MSAALERLRALYVAVVSDVLDELGHRDRTLAASLWRLSGDGQVIGRAATLQVARVDEMPDDPYAVQFAAVDALAEGQVMVVAGATANTAAFWGELITTRALKAGCAGVVLDGFTRDITAIRSYGFPLWARGTHPADCAGRLTAVGAGEPVTCMGTRIEPGDVVFGDADGIVAIPAALTDEVIAAAEQKARTEDKVRTDLRAGRTVADVYDQYGVM